MSIEAPPVSIEAPPMNAQAPNVTTAGPPLAARAEGLAASRTEELVAEVLSRSVAAQEVADGPKIIAAPEDANQTCLSFNRQYCPPLNLSIQSRDEQRQTHRFCSGYVKRERDLPTDATFCGQRLRRTNPCWVQDGVTSCLPHFFILGEMKCGTTTLYQLLDKHPQVVAPLTKEPRFLQQGRFSQTRCAACGSIQRARASAPPGSPRAGPCCAEPPRLPPVCLSLSRYAVNFRPAAAIPDSVTFDASPVYFRSPVARTWLRQWLPASRLILLVRNPIQRAFSHWKMGSEWLKSKCGGDEQKMRLLSRWEPRMTFERVAALGLLQENYKLCVREINGLRERECKWLGLDPQNKSNAPNLRPISKMPRMMEYPRLPEEELERVAASGNKSSVYDGPVGRCGDVSLALATCGMLMGPEPGVRLGGGIRLATAAEHGHWHAPVLG